jgi:hypothetical protein
MSVLSQFYGNGSPIKSIQRGTITIDRNSLTGTATIDAVNTSKTMLNLLGFTIGSNAAGTAEYLTRIALTNSTTITATRAKIVGGSTDNNTLVSYEVIEFN